MDRKEQDERGRLDAGINKRKIQEGKGDLAVDGLVQDNMMWRVLSRHIGLLISKYRISAQAINNLVSDMLFLYLEVMG